MVSALNLVKQNNQHCLIFQKLNASKTKILFLNKFNFIYFIDIAAVSETDGEEDGNLEDHHELVETLTSKPEVSQESFFNTSAFKNISTFLSSHIGSHSNPNKTKT